MNSNVILFMSFFYKARNKIINHVYSLINRKTIRIDWRAIRIVNPAQISIGDFFSAGQGLWLHAINNDSKIDIGDNVNISDWTHIAALKEVVIESGCLIGSRVLISDHAHGRTVDLRGDCYIRPNERELFSKGPIHVGKNVWIADGVVILPNVKIGEGAVIAANSVVNKDVPPFSLAAGIPAKVITMDKS